jgi:dTDP-4-dehydrorhamnose reductase
MQINGDTFSLNMREGDHSLWLIVGSDSKLARDTASTLERLGARVLLTSRRGRPGTIHLQLGQPLPSLPRPSGGGSAIIFAGVTEQGRCEAHPAETRGINVTSTTELAAKLVAAEWSVTFLSSDTIYPASAPAPAIDPAGLPRSEYGRQKLDAEMGLLRMGDQVSVLRLGKVIHLEAEPWVTWIRTLERGSPVEVFDDYFLDPVAPHDAVSAILKVGAADLGGVWQAGGSGPVSYYEFLEDLRRRWGLLGKVEANTKGTRLGLKQVPSRMSSDRLMTVLGWKPRGVASIGRPASLGLAD